MADAGTGPGLGQKSVAIGVSRWLVAIFGCAFIVGAILLVYVLVSFWPIKDSAGKWSEVVSLFGFPPFQIDFERRLLLIVIFTSGIGGFAHAATSFASYVGNNRFVASWSWWYVLRLPIGAALALVFYFLIRGGLLTAQGTASDASAINPFGIAAFAGLVGMFSKQATDKLQETFDTLFQTKPGEGDDQRDAKLEDQAPSISSAAVQPASANQPQRLTVQGTNFSSLSIVKINGVDYPGGFKDATTLVIDLVGGAALPAGTYTISVVNPPPAGESKPATFSVP